MNTLRKIAACVATWLIAAHPALALNDTIGVTAGAGKTANLISFGSTRVISEVGICDATTENQCASVSAGGALAVTGTITAVTAITNALPTGANVIGHVIADTGSTTAVTQATAGNLNATVVGTGTFATQATLATETTKVIGTVNLPATPTTNLANIDSQTSRLVTGATRIAPGSPLATTSFVTGTRYVATPPTFTDGQEGAFQIDAAGRQLVTANATLGAETTKVIGTVRVQGNIGGVLDAVAGGLAPLNAIQVGMAQSGTLVAMTGTSGNLNVQCANCSGSGVSVVDAASWTTMSSVFAPGGGVFNDSATALSSGTQGTQRVTPNRAIHTNLRNQAGTEMGTATNPLFVNGVGVTLGAALGSATASPIACDAINAWPTATTNATWVLPNCGLDGTLITRPFAPKEMLARGNASGTGATTVVAASGNAALKTYVTDWECYTTGAVLSEVTFNDVVGTGTSTKILVPATSGNNKSLHSPLVTAANTALTFTPSAGTVVCSVQGYYGP